MAFREVTMLEVKEVLRLWLRGRPKKVIARQVGLDVKTVRRYVEAAEGCGVAPESGEAGLNEGVLAAVLSKVQGQEVGRPRGEGWELCETHREVIQKYLESKVRPSKIRKLLVRRGVTVPSATLYRYVTSELGFGRRGASILVADCGPAEELQVDTGVMGLLEPDSSGKRRRLLVWIFTAVLSRHRFVYPVFRETTQTAIEACEAAWVYYGGIFRTLIPDNTKTIVQEPDPLEPKLNPTFLEYAQARGFAIDTARVKKPKDKARVEKSVRDIRDDWFAGEKLHSLEESQESARSWSFDEYGMRRHTRTQRMPREYFETVERPALLPLPTEPYDIPLWSDPKIARDGHAQVAKALYSLPHRYVGRTLKARADKNTVRFYLQGQLIKVHPRMAPGGRSTDRQDLPQEKTAYALRDVNYLASEAKKHGVDVGLFALALLKTDLPWTRMRKVYALLGLVKRFGEERVNQACATALKADMLSIRRLQRMIEVATPAPHPRPRQNVIPIARYLRDPKQYALPLGTKKGEDS
jgi:transposase